MAPLAHHVALVTGGSRGIGGATAVALAQAGADVCINHFQDADNAAEVVARIEQLGRRALAIDADVSDPDAVDAMVESLVDHFGRLDAAVLSAIYSDREPLLTASLEGLRRTIDVSMWGALFTLRAVARQMVASQTRGAITAISSPHAYKAYADCMAYNMAKAAVDQMCRSAALEFAPHRIRVNWVYPGWTDTPGERKFYTDEQLEKAAAGLPWGRLARPDEIARAVVFLTDPASEYLTGSSILVDGGITMPWNDGRARAQPDA